MGIRATVGLKFKLRQKIYTIEKMIDANRFHARNDKIGHDVMTLDSNTVVKLIENGEIEFLTTRHLKSDITYTDFGLLPPEEKAAARRRQAYVIKYLDMTRYGRTDEINNECIKIVSAKINDNSPPKTRTLRRWADKFIKSNGDTKVFITNHKAKANGRKLDPVVMEIITRLSRKYYMTSKYVTFEDLKSAINLEIDTLNELRDEKDSEKLTYPCIDTLYRHIKTLNPKKLLERRYGKRVAKLIMRTIGGKKLPTRPMEVCEIDSTIMDVFVISDQTFLPIGRPILIVMIDIVTRTICGFYIGFDPPSGFSTMYCLHHAFCSKDYVAEMYPEVEHSWDNHGLPEVLVVDNGGEFINESLEDACFQLGIKLIPSPRKEPWFKGKVERWFQTQNTGLLHSIPGATFSDKKSRLDKLKRYGYNPEKDAVVTFSNLIKLMHIFIVDYYHQKQHSGLHKRIPSRVWKELIDEYPAIYPPKNVDLDSLLGIIERRTLTQRGIEFKGLMYNCSKLTELRFRHGDKSIPVIFKYNPTDISFIKVKDEAFDTYITVPALNQEYTRGLSMREHETIIRQAKKDAQKDQEIIGISCLFRARDKIRRTIDDDIQKAKNRHRKRAAQYDGVRMNVESSQTNQKRNKEDKNPDILSDFPQPQVNYDHMDFTKNKHSIATGSTPQYGHQKTSIPSHSEADNQLIQDNEDQFDPENDVLEGDYDLFK